MAHEHDECDAETWKKMSGMGLAWRVSASAVGFFGWLAFFILWLAFYAGDYSVWENIAVIIMSLLGLLALLASVWIPFGIRFADQTDKKMNGGEWASCLAGVAWLAFLVIWLMQYAGDYDIYQNIAVFIVSVLVFGGISAAASAVAKARAH
ncbi:MAG: hypothetical protein MUE65_00535 [Methanomassiliicoccales archaeon]|jgi:hypothetical protein|nr:hypothetical protein [Methanomassiliicoccales archaeon]